MKKCLALAAALAALTASADARIITYTWNQTSASYPGLVFTAHYSVYQNVPPHHADSHHLPPVDHGGIVDLYVEGGGYPAITLADLVPSCLNSSGCGTDNFGSPDWQIDMPYLFFLQARDYPSFPYHIEWDYQVSATSIQVNDDNANHGCFNQFDCYTTGYWTSNFVPEPATLPAVLGGLGLLSLACFRRRVLP